MSDNKELLPIAWRWRWKAYVTSIGPSHPKYGWQYEDGAEKPSVHPDNVQHIDFQPLYAAQPVVLSDEQINDLKDAIGETEYKYFGCYEFSESQHTAVDVLVEVARMVIAAKEQA